MYACVKGRDSVAQLDRALLIDDDQLDRVGFFFFF
jgi:hypothetical protein